MSRDTRKGVDLNQIFKDLMEEEDILIIIILSSLSLLLIYFPIDNGFLNSVIHIILFYVLPGYVLTMFIFPKKESISIIKRVSLFVMTSIVIFTFLGLLLSSLSLSVNNTILATANYLFINTFSYLLFKLRRKISSENKFSIKKDIILRLNYHYDNISKGEKLSSIFLISLMIISVMALFYIANNPGLEEPYTEFYLLGPDGETSNIPINFTLGKGERMLVRIVNHEQSGLNYRLQVLHRNEVMLDYEVYLMKEKMVDINFFYNPKERGVKQMLVFNLYEYPDIKLDELKLYINVY